MFTCCCASPALFPPHIEIIAPTVFALYNPTEQVVRVDMREMLTMAAGERAASYDGLQVNTWLRQEYR